MHPPIKTSPPHGFRHFFLRGLAIVLPTLLTIWIVTWSYGFIDNQIAQPINTGLKELVLLTSPYPAITEDQIAEYRVANPAKTAGRPETELRQYVRRERIDAWWNSTWLPMDLLGLFIAIFLIYMAGALVGSFLGRRLQSHGEGVIERLPLVGKIYQATKQVTEFFFGSGDQKLKFNRVVAVEYPRKGIWSLGLVTGDTMRTIQDQLARPCVTIFIPSSPTPFTGYVITVPAADTIDLGISIEDALRFVISGGVIVPQSQKIPAAPSLPSTEATVAST